VNTAAAVAALAALLHLFAKEYLGPLDPLAKMTPVLVLAVLVLRAPPSPARLLAGVGLLLGAVADAVIEFSFLGGLAVFLLAHVLYVAAFVRFEPRLRLARLGPVALWAALVLPVLVSQAGALALPVLAYGLVIFTMIWRAAAATESFGWNAGTLGLAGALLFGLSDTLLGYSRFAPQGQTGALTAPPASNFLIMGTYWGGQTLIAISFLKRYQRY
jgi:uncharacterized membrane protein YhhN